MVRSRFPILLLTLFSLLNAPISEVYADKVAEAKTQSSAPKELRDYVQKPDPAFKWSLEETTEFAGTNVYRLNVVSQNWHDIVWHHAVMVYEPQDLQYPEQMLLFVTGGKTGGIPGKNDYLLGTAMAQQCGSRIAFLHHVPNQPLYGGKNEDDLITETWLRYLDTGDASWPLLFPMVKSATSTMDALQAFSKEKFSTDVSGFVVTGASKRGWTSWLSAAADDRVIGIAPMVIDVLDFSAQMKYQKETWGFFSEQIADYTSKGLVTEDGIPESGAFKDLWTMMDPYSYRNVITVPKLLIVGANDRYWSVNAMNLYWDGLVGQKYIYRVPNAGHNLDDGKSGREYAIGTLARFYRNVVTGQEMPKISWKQIQEEGKFGIQVESEQKPSLVRLWTATSETTDFRESVWTPKTIRSSTQTYDAFSKKPESGHIAVFAEVQFIENDKPYSLSTLVYWE